MANEIQLIHDDAAETIYAIVRETASTGRWYDNTTDHALETFDSANWATYAITLAQVDVSSPPTTGNAAYQGTFPALAAGFYWLDVYVRAGAAAAQTDVRTASYLFYWNATALVPAGGAADAQQVSGSATAADHIESVFLGTGHTDDVDISVRKFDVTNDAGPAVTLSGTTYGMRIIASAGNGLSAQGSGVGLVALGSAGAGARFAANADGVDGLQLLGVASGSGLRCFNTAGGGDATGHGIYATGGATSGDGIRATAANGNGMIVVGAGVGYDLNADIHGTLDTAESSVAAALAAYPVPLATDVQDSAAAALEAYNSTGVAKEDSVGAIATILAGISSLAHWLRGLYNKRAMDSTALTEIRDSTGTFDPTTDSNEAIADKTSGLTAQQTRDALKLAPSTGDPAAGSIDAELDTLDTVVDAIKSKSDLIGSASITVISPVAQSGKVEIYSGNDYLLSESRALPWVVTGAEVAFLDGATVTLRILRAPLFHRGHTFEDLEADAEFEGDVVVADEKATITVELLAADTSALDASSSGYVYQLVAETTDKTTHTIAAGVFTVVKTIQEPGA